jgi:hypothetical protein
MITAKSFSFFILLTLITLSVTAQRSIIKGYLRDSITHYPITNGTVTNWNTQKKARTNERGFFFLEVTPGDRLYVQAPAYFVDTLYYTPFFADTVTLYLSPSGSMLPEVTVRSAYNKYQLDSIRRREDFEAMRGTVLKTVGPPPITGFGINLSLDRFFKKKYHQKAKAGELFQKTEERRYIDFRFSAQMVAFYTQLKGDALRDFMYRYTPSYTWLRQHPTQQEVLFYINDKLKLFRATNPKSQIPKSDIIHPTSLNQRSY